MLRVDPCGELSSAAAEASGEVSVTVLRADSCGWRGSGVEWQRSVAAGAATVCLLGCRLTAVPATRGFQDRKVKVKRSTFKTSQAYFTIKELGDQRAQGKVICL